MDIALDEVLHFDAITSNPSTGAAADADSTPTWEVFEEDTDTAIASGNFTKRTSKTGNYRGTHTLSSANGYEVGKWYTVVASATVNSVAGKGIVQRFRVVPAESTAGVPKTDVTHFGGTAGTFASGRPEVSNVVGTVSGAVGSVTGNVGGNVVGSVGSVAGGVTVTTNNDKTGYSLTPVTGLGNQTANITGNLSGSVGSVTSTVPLGTNAPANWINAAAIATGAITDAKFAAGAITSTVIATDAIGAAQIAADAIGASELAASAVTEIQSGLMLAASYTAPANADIAAIKAKTDNLPADPAGQSAVASAITAAQTAIITQGNTSWVTATGFSTHSAADVWAVATRTITGGSLTTAPPTAAAIADAVWDEARTGHTTTGTFGFFLDAQVSQIAGGGGGTIIIDTNGVNAIVNALLAQGPTLYTALTTEENTLRVADEYVQQFRGLGDISGRSNIAFALKTRKTDADTAALIYLTETGGLTRVNGAAYATTANGSITVDDATAGNITVRLSSAVTASLTVGNRQDCVKILITGGNDITKRQGITNVIDATVDALAT